MTTTKEIAMTMATTGERAPDLDHPALDGYLATLPPDPELDRLAADLTEAYGVLAAERERAAALRRRRAATAATLATATGAARDDRLRELLLVDADAATTPAAIGEATRVYALAGLAWFGRVLALAETEVRETIARTDGPITALGKARHAVDVAEGYFGAAPAPAKVPELRATAAAMAAELAPDLERHRRATEATGIVRALVASAYGDVRPFYRGDYGSSTRETAAKRAGADAAARARQGAAA